MKINLQQTGYRESPYERPTQKWVCGHASESGACPLGPDAKGECTAQAQRSCQPRREGDRWHCTRLGVYGGTCANGPNPDGTCCQPEPEFSVCQPRLSLRAKRKRLTYAGMALTIGLLAIALSGPWAADVISPGELSHAHLAIQGVENGQSNCAVCHNTSDEKHSGLLSGALAMPNRLTQSENCLTCHFDQSRDLAMKAHNASVLSASPLPAPPPPSSVTTPPASPKIPAASPPTIKLAVASILPRPHLDIKNEIACATCHQEHRGKWHNISQMSDTQCQVCHQDQFASFNEGHPAFGLVPRSRGGIAFDHKQHEESGFGQRAFVCSDCHAPDTAGLSMKLKPYDQSCSGCHNQGMDDRHGAKIKDNSHLVFQLPMFEVEDLYWPEDAAYGEDELPALMRLLLLGDDAAIDGLRAIDDDADGIPFDWLPDEPEPMDQFTQAVKRMLDDLANGDESARVARIAKALGVEVSDPRVASLAEPLAAANFAMLAYQQRWLPLLADDLAGDDVAGEDAVGPEWAFPNDHSGWYADEGDVAVYYRPMGHADPVVKGVIDALMSSRGDQVDTVQDDADTFRAEQRQLILEQLTGDGSFARSACLKCHTVEEEAGLINWSAANRSVTVSGFAKFNHKPHMAMLRESDNCSQCHQRQPEGDTPSALSHGGFMPHTQATCATCHTPTQANNSCLNCHVYHQQRP